jgi:hypothetical protein
MFLKLATWILLRFRQITNRPLRDAVDGLLIPDHPSCFEIETETDFKEALGMTRLYSALTHIDTHPEYLAHMFHAIGNASCEGRLESSRPDMRPLPEPPNPVLRYVVTCRNYSTNHSRSMMDDAALPWLFALPLEDSVISDNMDDEGVCDDVDGGSSIAMALDDMVISNLQGSAKLLLDVDIPKRKRTLSKALSPPKVILFSFDHMVIFFLTYVLYLYTG